MDGEHFLQVVSRRLGLAPPMHLSKTPAARDLHAIAELLAARAPLGVALGAFALLAGAAASSAAAQAPAVAEATTDGAPNPSTLLADAALVDPKPADTTSADPRTLADATAATSGAASSYASTADRRALRGCNPKKNTSCCRDRKSKCAKQVFGNPLKPWKCVAATGRI